MPLSIEVALIAPGAIAGQFCHTRSCQMALAGELVSTRRPPYYRAFYKTHRDIDRTRWILDNGAWEDEPVGPHALIQLADEFGITEVVAPDILNDSLGTYKEICNFLNIVKGFEEDLEDWTAPDIAVVAHGKSVREAKEFIDGIARQQDPHIKTIMIGRAFARAVGNPTARYELALHIQSEYGSRYAIHLLGFNDDWPTELQNCRSWPGLIRSMDTAAPFIYAMHGMPIENVYTNQAPGRPKDYFNQTSFPEAVLNMVRHNIKTLDEWAASRQW